LVLRDFFFAGFAFFGFGDVIAVGVLGGGATTASLAFAFREGEEGGREGGDGCFFDEAGFEDGAAFLDEETLLFFFLFFFFFFFFYVVVGGGVVKRGGGGGVGGGGRGAELTFEGGELGV